MEVQDNNFIIPPSHILKANNHLRYFSIIALLIITAISFLLIRYVGLFIGILGIYCSSMILLIKFPRIELYETHFKLIKKSIYNRLSEQTIFNYSNLLDIEYSEGFTNWLRIFLEFFMTGRARIPRVNEQNSKSDSMIITMKNEAKIEIARIGSREDFLNLIKLIKLKMPCS